jgi:alpha-glucosidase
MHPTVDLTKSKRQWLLPLAAVSGVTAALICSSATAEAKVEGRAAEGAEGRPGDWWKHAVLYEIYPRSFADSNDDGIGDLKGITSKIPYLRSLGVDAIWITPCFPSPQVDFGYDVSNYEDIDPIYGTLADFDDLVNRGKQSHLNVILDFVVNHTSDQHPWFVDSRSSRDSRHRNWYIWHDGTDTNRPPNNWVSLFGGSAWTYDAKTAQYYYHYFYPQQPDLNWRNPKVETAMLDVTRWWYRRGVAGFRLDAVDTIFESPTLTDNPVLPGLNKLGDPVTVENYNRRLPENHQVLKKLRHVADEFGAVLIGETWTEDIAGLTEYYGEHDDELQLPMNFLFATVNRLSPPAFRAQIAAAEATGKWPVYLLSNHDIVRSYDRYGDGTHNDAIAKMMAAFYLTLRGTPILYYGEEIGMQNSDPRRREDVKDPIGVRGWPKEKGRDGERTPMQWTQAANAGFTRGEPWLPVPATFVTHNVETESRDPDSVLGVYRSVIALRRSNLALHDGTYEAINNDDQRVLAYLRMFGNEVVLVALNMSNTRQRLRPDLRARGLTPFRLERLLATQGASATRVSVTLPPFSAFIARVLRDP